jgi:hypothetical protein
VKDLNLFRKVYKFFGVEIFSEESFEKKDSTSFILINLKLIFELCVLNLI